MKTNYIIGIIATILVLSGAAFAFYLSVYKSPETGGNWDGRVITQLDAESKMGYFTKDIHFEYDSSVLPSAHYAMLDSVIAVMREYDGDGFQYIFEVHSHQEGRNDAEELRYAQQVADGIRKYVVHSGINSSTIEAVGIGTKERDCFEEKGDVDCFRRNNRLEVRVRW